MEKIYKQYTAEGRRVEVSGSAPYGYKMKINGILAGAAASLRALHVLLPGTAKPVPGSAEIEPPTWEKEIQA